MLKKVRGRGKICVAPNNKKVTRAHFRGKLSNREIKIQELKFGSVIDIIELKSLSILVIIINLFRFGVDNTEVLSFFGRQHLKLLGYEVRTIYYR